MASTLYTTDILRMATEIPHRGRLEDADGRADLRAPICGSRIAVDVRLDHAGRVTAFAQDVRACAMGQAAAHLLGADIIGRSGADLAAVAVQLADWLARPDAQVPDWPGLLVLEPARAHPGRHAAICLPFEAAAAAIRAAGRTQREGGS